MSFHSFFFAMPGDKRDKYAAEAGTTRGVLNQIAYGNKAIELGFADVLVALARGAVSLDDLPLTLNARRQRTIRESAPRVPLERSANDLKAEPQEERRAA